MSVYKAKDSQFYQYDFQLRGHRFHGSTKCKSKREAEAADRQMRDFRQIGPLHRAFIVRETG